MSFDAGGILFYIITGTVLFVLLVVFLVAFTMMYMRRQQQYDEEKIEMERTFSEELLRTQLELSEQVMKSISEEIHDNIGQTLVVAKLGLNALGNSENKNQVQNINELISRSLRDLRSLSKNLNGEYILREGIQNALVREINILNNTREVIAEFSGSIPDGWFSPNSEIIVFRCAQEAMSNALKHAKAKKISVLAEVSGNKLNLTIEDDGNGFHSEDEMSHGIGMSTMEKRAAVLGGKFRVNSTVGKGTKVIFEFPKPNDINSQ